LKKEGFGFDFVQEKEEKKEEGRFQFFVNKYYFFCKLSE